MEERSGQAEGVQGREAALRDTAGTATRRTHVPHPQSISHPEGTLMYARGRGDSGQQGCAAGSFLEQIHYLVQVVDSGGSGVWGTAGNRECTENLCSFPLILH